jgi:Flp pilus assembly protein CpaB
MTYRMRNILIAVALAGFAALLVTFYISNYKSSVQHQQAQVTVLVAAHDITQSTTGADVVSKGWLKTEQVTRSSVVPGAISSPDQIKSLVATQSTYTGEQITAARFGPTTQAGVAGTISGTQRAFQLSGDPNQVLAGTLQPGDHVDFEGVTTVHFSGNSAFDLTFSRIVVRDIKVIQTQAAGSTSGKLGGGNSLTSVMLRVTDAQSQKIALIYAAARQGSNSYWTLELRPGLKSQDSPNSVETPFTLLTDGIAATTLRAALGVGAVAAAGGH